MTPGSSNPAEFEFVCPLPHGMHARPASQMAEFARGFASQFRLINQRTGAQANLKSPLAILSTDVRGGDSCSIRIHGVDQELARGALKDFVAQELAKADEAGPEVEAEFRPAVLPRALQSPAITRYPGVAVSPGIGNGKAVVVGRIGLSEPVNGKQ